jgi:drug/metabolite transporter (DMT)-like permease
MDTSNFATSTTILAEIALALHPILIKQINVGLPTQLLARLGTYSVLATAFSGPQDRKYSWGSWSTATKSLGFGLMNLVHIGASYISYKHLPAGSALALFYTYPFLNILAGTLFLGETLDFKILPLMFLAFIGVLLVSRFSNEDTESAEKEKTAENYENPGTAGKPAKNTALGVAASLISAMTETLIFLIAKSGEEPTPWLPILKLYPGALVALLGWILISGTSWKTSSENWIPLILFNVFIGFLGYSLRFWSIPRLSTAVFSILTFIGVAAGYTWGLAYAKEVPNAGALLGAGCITGALGILKTIQPS